MKWYLATCGATTNSKSWRGTPKAMLAPARREAAKEADALLLAVHLSRIDDERKQAGDLSSKVMVTCCLPMDSGNTKLIVATTTSGAEELAKKAPNARVVCGFNTVPVKCCSASSRQEARNLGRAWCNAAMT